MNAQLSNLFVRGKILVTEFLSVEKKNILGSSRLSKAAEKCELPRRDTFAHDQLTKTSI
jgi:hypothetical protein